MRKMILLLSLIVWIGTYSSDPAHAVASSSCTPAADFEVSADVYTLTLQGGATASFEFTLTPVDGFAGTVLLSTTNLPTGITATVSQSSLDLSAGPRMSTVTVATLASLALGEYHFDVNATAGTTVFHDTPITVHISNGELGITASNQYLTIMTNSTASVTITLIPLYGLANSTVNLNATILGLPSGYRPPAISISPVSVPLIAGHIAISTVTISTLSTTPSEYNFKVAGMASSGSVSNSTWIYVNVIAPGLSIMAQPGQLVVPVGSSKDSIINITSTLGFNGSVNLTAALDLPFPIPSAPTATLSLATVTLTAGSSATSILTIQTTASTSLGIFPFVVDGQSGSIKSMASLAVRVDGPDFSVTSNPANLTVSPGPASTSEITLGSLRGFTGTVALSLFCAPDGLTASVTAGNVPLASGGSDSVTLTVSSSSFTATGNYTVEVQGSAVGPTPFTTLYNDTIVKVIVPPPDFGISLNPGSRTVPAGKSVMSTIDIVASNGFVGTISLSTVVSPPGPMLSLSTSTISGGSGKSILTIEIGSNEEARTYIVTIEARSLSIAHSIKANLTVTSAPVSQPTSGTPKILGFEPTFFFGVVGGLVSLGVIVGMFILRIRKPKVIDK